jgi:23S rRNA (pseudouridine1915-N3)-methyltransferase
VRLAILAVGRLKAGPERELVERYVGRAGALARSLGLSGPDVAELPEARAWREADRRAEEGAAILAKAGEGIVIALDERGRALDSPGFAAALGGWRDSGRPSATFVIGGPDGLDESVRARADLVLSFGALTISASDRARPRRRAGLPGIHHSRGTSLSSRRRREGLTMLRRTPRPIPAIATLPASALAAALGASVLWTGGLWTGAPGAGVLSTPRAGAGGARARRP